MNCFLFVFDYYSSSILSFGFYININIKIIIMVHHSLNNANTSLLHKVFLSTTLVFLFGLVFLHAEGGYWGLQLSGPVVVVVGNTESWVMPTSSRNLTAKKTKKQSKKNSKSQHHGHHGHGLGRLDDGIIPIGGKCDDADDCVIPPGLDHAVCLQELYDVYKYNYLTCQSGQPGARCGQTSDCVIPTGLEHPVCLEKDASMYSLDYCQSGQPGARCGQTSDCVVPSGLEHPVCRQNACQSGQSSARCGQTSDCVIPRGLDHAVCRKK